ncbi:unnamed protein product [Miscanthus lutarioriparius]|uniref:Uncharacterized protein n=1 Tax=Miscanthus lutarioriparius TaxID=422564 RepID=A0A811P366_9POAL|nr:unnamed protein product [Miscanthus lutarioriparius]
MCETATAAPLGVANHYHLISLHSPHRGAPGLRNTTPAPEKRAERRTLLDRTPPAFGCAEPQGLLQLQGGSPEGVSAGGDRGEGRPGAGTRSVERPGAVNLGAAAEGVQEHSMSAQPICLRANERGQKTCFACVGGVRRRLLHVEAARDTGARALGLPVYGGSGNPERRRRPDGWGCRAEAAGLDELSVSWWGCARRGGD